ncbi:hypothetical protein [Longimicrobium sp.]|uniref:hypothetical protein n=1 Tax=Longimicrobium sp. TaxID=2029185 RepID=UPI002E3622DA|nr:hypothetical protein [Longimicrobium sp.]HEX6038376.1 hypothetical protein [Longimicrobium sp.]
MSAFADGSSKAGKVHRRAVRDARSEWNSPLELREVRLRGLHRRHRAAEDAPPAG